MMGSIATTRSGRAKRRWPRSAARAMSVPSKVVVAAVSTPRNKVFQATPQREPPATQARLKLRSLAMRATNRAMASRPSSSMKAPASAFITGKTMNRASSAAAQTTQAETNRSPRKKPRRARPKLPRTSSAASASAAPQPRPGCRTGNAKPAASSRTTPPKPPASSSSPCARPGRRAAATAHAPSPAMPLQTHGRPCDAACSRPLAVAAPSHAAAKASRPLASWRAYHGHSRQPTAPSTTHAHSGAFGARSRPRAARVAWKAPASSPARADDATRRQRGSALISFSQRAMRRRRSVLAPYFA